MGKKETRFVSNVVPYGGIPFSTGEDEGEDKREVRYISETVPYGGIPFSAEEGKDDKKEKKKKETRYVSETVPFGGLPFDPIPADGDSSDSDSDSDSDSSFKKEEKKILTFPFFHCGGWMLPCSPMATVRTVPKGLHPDKDGGMNFRFFGPGPAGGYFSLDMKMVDVLKALGMEEEEGATIVKSTAAFTWETVKKIPKGARKSKKTLKEIGVKGGETIWLAYGC